MRANKGFTLVEILIVVVILGILAAIVIPQFAGASIEAKESRLKSDLQTMRSMIQLYYMQHNETYPLIGDLTRCLTEETGISGDAPDGNEKPYGRYLDEIPENPFNNKVSFDNTGLSNDEGGWEYNETTGKVWADDMYDAAKDGVFDHADY